MITERNLDEGKENEARPVVGLEGDEAMETRTSDDDDEDFQTPKLNIKTPIAKSPEIMSNGRVRSQNRNKFFFHTKRFYKFENAC